MVDLDAYFARIGYSGPHDATLATLARLHELHPAAIPFETLAAFVNEAPSLDLANIQAKLVKGGRGGWCFEQNLLFQEVLTSLGFEVKRLAARVRWNVPPNVVTPRSHCLMQVTIASERYVADVGFGGLVLTGPLRLVHGVEQATPHEPQRILEEGGIHLMQAKVAGEWQTLYTFELNEAQVADYEVSNWYLSNFPQSHFVTTVVAARSLPGVRHVLRGNRYQVHHMAGSSERRFLTSVKDLLEVLEGPLGIRVPRSPKLEERLAKMIEASPAEA